MNQNNENEKSLKPMQKSLPKFECEVECENATFHRQRRRYLRSTHLCYGSAVLISSSFFILLPSSQSLVFSVPTSDYHQSPLFRRHQHQRQATLPHRRQGRNTPRFMVLTTPESIIEQASTQKLLDDLIDESVRTSARRPIMLQFDPSSGWIWRRWTGTVFSETWRSCVTNMLYAVIMYFIYRSNPGKIKEHLAGFNVLWGQLLQVTTFTLTFFVNQSYALWRKCSEMSRRLQGRLNDIGMFLAPHAARKTPSSPNEPSTYTTASRQLLELVSRYVRLFNLLTYASFTRSHRPILTPRGMRRLVERGLMTPLERQVLVSSAIPATQRHNAILLWIVRAFIEGRQHGHLVGGAGFENEFLEKIHVTRASYGAIGDELQGRMPLAYAHLVQVLVDVILWTYPVMAYTSGISPVLVILGTGLLTMSYQGLFDLAKQFLDPYDNENYGKGEDPLCVDTLIAETNAGSIRWMNSFEEMPFSAQRIKDGELFEYLLPVRGISVEELQEQEQDKLLKEQREREERLKQEEEERVKKEEEKERARLMVEAQDMEAIALYTLENVTSTIGTAMNETVIPSEIASLDLIPTESNETDAVALDAPPAAEKTKTVHKVTSLESGMPVTFDPQQQVELTDILEKAPADESTSDEPRVALAEKTTEMVNGAINKVEPVVAELNVPVNGDHQDDDPMSETSIADEDSIDEDPWSPLLGSAALQDLPWLDEVGPDGEELRLSQILANEEWEEEKTAGKEPLTFEEYRRRADEIIEVAENELRETEEILNLTPGSRASPFPADSDKQKKTPPVRYDQTRMDGISQLWGLPPEDPADLLLPKEVPSFDESQFDGISQLWGQTLPPSALVASDATVVLGPESFGGISQLWGDTPLDDLVNEQRLTLSVGSGGKVLDKEFVTSLATKTPWLDEESFEGKGRRLSEVLADEVWEDQLAATAAATFRDYNKQVSDTLESTKDEELETEAILKAPPGAFSVDVPEKEEGIPLKTANATVFASNVAIDGTEKDIDNTLEATTGALDADEDLGALEMDAVMKADDKLAPRTDGEGASLSVSDTANQTSSLEA